MRKYIHLLYLGFFAALGCKKSESLSPTIISGRVTDAVTGRGVAAARIFLTDTEPPDEYGHFSRGSNNRIEIAESVTDVEGHFHFEFQAREGWAYHLYAQSNKLYIASPAIPVESGNVVNNFALSMQPYGWVRIHFVNEPPSNYARLTCNEVIYSFLDSTNKDFVVFSNRHGNAKTDIQWAIRQQDTTHTFTQNLYVPAHDTTDFTIKY